MIRVVFFGTPDFALPIFQALVAAQDIQVVGVVTQQDKPVGRKKVMTPSPVGLAARAKGLPVFAFASLKKSGVVEALRALDAHLFVVFSYGKILPKAVLDIPPLGCVNVHPSKLPRYRGPTPVPAAILHGDTSTAVSIMLLDEGMDTGPLLAQQDVAVLPDDTTPILMRRLIHDVGAPLLIQTIRDYANGQIKAAPQSASGVSVTPLFSREDGQIAPGEPIEMIDRKIRAFTPWPGAFTIIKHAGKDLRVKLLSSPTQGEARRGQFLVQPEGKKPMAFAEFERGYGPLFP